MRKIILLGASGSIGTQTLDILRARRDDFKLSAFSVGKRSEFIDSILSDFKEVERVYLLDESQLIHFKAKYPSVHFYSGERGIVEMIHQSPNADMVVNALVGFSGLLPSIASLEDDKILALANKESLVVGGEIINNLLKEGHGKIYPIDSEHVAIAKLLSSVDIEEVEKIFITASGGSFRNLSRERLVDVTPEMALAHPTWNMGAKITIDCASMMNKGFEVLEAKVLFDFPLEKTDILMHRESHAHSALLMKDGSYLLDISVPDMHGPIEYALYESKVEFSLTKVSSLEELEGLHFSPYDPDRYPLPMIARRAYERGGTALAILNAADEVAVNAFLEGKLSFLEIEEEIENALSSLPIIAHPDIQTIIEADADTREYVQAHIEERRPR